MMSCTQPERAHLQEWFSYDPEVGEFRWRKQSKYYRRGQIIDRVAGVTRKTGYVFVWVPGFGHISAHRLAWIYVHGAIPDGLEIDHRDGNRANNCIGNLRLATLKEQARNRGIHSNNRSGLKGAYRDGNRWRSQIQVDGRFISLGSFGTADEAHAAYARAAVAYFGNFARVR